LPLAGFVEFAAIETDMDDDTILVAGLAPAIAEQMIAEIVDRNYVSSDHRPLHVDAVAATHVGVSLLLTSGTYYRREFDRREEVDNYSQKG
jgi:hypothetical protein